MTEEGRERSEAEEDDRILEAIERDRARSSTREDPE
jgi:hypothetical protein